MKKKIVFSILILIVLGIIAFIMYSIDKYNKSDKGLTKIYKKEIQDVTTLNENQVAIKILKEDFNGDSNIDYIGIIGVPKYKDEKDLEPKNDLEKLTATLEMYNNVEVFFVDGSSREVKKYASELSFYPEVNLEVKTDNTSKYIFVSDNTSGNVLLLNYVEGELKNIIKNSIESNFNGYTITVNFDNENTSKIKVKLDNYARSYLNTVNEEYTLEFTNSNINKDNYRPTYLANKYCNFKLEDIDQDGILDLVGVQNILYLNIENKELPKIVGTVETAFKISEGKITFNKVDVKL